MSKPSPLDIADRNSATWAKIKQHMEARMDLLAKRNEGDHDERRTNRIRGGIAELRYLISLGDERMKENPDDALFKD